MLVKQGKTLENLLRAKQAHMRCIDSAPELSMDFATASQRKNARRLIYRHKLIANTQKIHTYRYMRAHRKDLSFLTKHSNLDNPESAK